MLTRLILLFVALPVLELWLLLQIGGRVGLWPTLALVFATGVVGATLARAQGMKVLLDFQKATAEGRMPGQAMLDGVSVLVGGAFLLTPGLLTDIFGFSLVIPFTRRLIQRHIQRRVERAMQDGTLQATVISTIPGRPVPDSEPPSDWEK